MLEDDHTGEHTHEQHGGHGGGHHHFHEREPAAAPPMRWRGRVGVSRSPDGSGNGSFHLLIPQGETSRHCALVRVRPRLGKVMLKSTWSISWLVRSAVSL